MNGADAERKEARIAVVLFGSPREQGNTDVLLGEVVRGLRENATSLDVREHVLRHLEIRPCQECRACDTRGACVIADAMQDIYTDVDAAHYIILGSPVFFYGFSATAKAVIDRAQALWARKYVLRRSSPIPRASRGGWLVAVGATRGTRLFEGMTLTAKYFFDALDMPFQGTLLARGVDEKGAMERRPELLARAQDLGRAVATGKIVPSGSDGGA